MLSHGSVSMASSKLCLKDTHKLAKQTHFIIFVFLPLEVERSQCSPHSSFHKAALGIVTSLVMGRYKEPQTKRLKGHHRLCVLLK